MHSRPMNCLFVQFPLLENKIEIHKTKKKNRERERDGNCGQVEAM